MAANNSTDQGREGQATRELRFIDGDAASRFKKWLEEERPAGRAEEVVREWGIMTSIREIEWVEEAEWNGGREGRERVEEGEAWHWERMEGERAKVVE